MVLERAEGLYYKSYITHFADVVVICDRNKAAVMTELWHRVRLIFLSEANWTLYSPVNPQLSLQHLLVVQLQPQIQ